MADKVIGELPGIYSLDAGSLFVAEQNGQAVKVSGKQLTDFSNVETAAQVEQAKTSAQEAKTAQAAAESAILKGPVIQNGTWWVYNQTAGAYQDTGIKATGPQGPQGEPGKDGADGKSAYSYAQDGGYTGSEEEFAAKLAEEGTPSVKRYGAKGDGITDDTVAFQTALAENRVVSVPGGTYKLSGTLVIGENCCLELSQDTILQFTQTQGNCIEMRGSAVLRGNHGILSAAYGLTGKVISMDTALDGEAHNSIPPYVKADPMFKRQRFVYDVNIIKPTADGFTRSADGKCNGTAIYMSAEGTASIRWMWAITMSGIRISGGFSYGIRAANFDKAGDYTDNAWNHDMRIEAVIEACEVGVSLENCNGARLNVTVQPCQAVNGTAYAKWGVYLNDSRFVDMTSSRVWDWNATNSLWTSGGEYQHLALIGNCKGLLLDDFIVHETSADIRTLIYTDTQSNFDTMTILQEPGNKNFKAVDGVPYFNDGTANKKLMLASDKFTAEQMEFIHPSDGYYTYEADFANLVKGYNDGYYLGTDGALVANTGYVTTDFIPIDGAAAHTYRIGGDGIVWKDGYGYGRIAWYDADKNLKGSVMGWDKIGLNIYYPEWVEDDTVAAAFATNQNVVPPNGAAYFRITAKGSGANLAVTIDEAQNYIAIWHGDPKRLDDSIHAINDWNAAEGDPGYVKNRTHYKETVELANGTAVWADEVQGLVLETDTEFVVGETYTITYNGVTYTCTAFEFDNEGTAAVCVGNGVFLELEDTGEPFLMITMGGLLSVVDLNGATEATVRITAVRAVPLPREYLPKMCHVIDVEDVATSGTSKKKFVNMTYDTTELLEALKNGYPVWLNITGNERDNRAQVTGWNTLTLSLDEQIRVGLEPSALQVFLYAWEMNSGTDYKWVLMLNMTD